MIHRENPLEEESKYYKVEVQKNKIVKVHVADHLLVLLSMNILAIVPIASTSIIFSSYYQKNCKSMLKKHLGKWKV